jgi:glycosyltransferase involved in cell wall biosynthesis
LTRVGFETYAHEGPGIFLSRLKTAFEAMGCFDDQNPDVWINLSFKPIPEWIQQRRQHGKTKLVVRMDGAYCGRSHKIHKPVVIPVPVLDNWYSAKVNRKKNTLIRQNLLTADTIIFQSEFSRRITQRFVTTTPPGYIIYNGVNLQSFLPDGETFLPKSANVIRILMSHSFRPYHRLHDGFRILKALQAQYHQQVQLIILGGDDGKTFSDSIALASQLGLKNGQDYTLLGKHPFEALPPIYRSCHFMLNLSYWDTCPNVAIEAMACGLPVLGVKHGGLAELVDPLGGILVKEAIPFDYIDHQNSNKMPQAPVEEYCEAALQLLAQQDNWQQKARVQADTRFDINTIAARYLHLATASLASHK